MATEKPEEPSAFFANLAYTLVVWTGLGLLWRARNAESTAHIIALCSISMLLLVGPILVKRVLA